MKQLLTNMAFVSTWSLLISSVSYECLWEGSNIKALIRGTWFSPDAYAKSSYRILVRDHSFLALVASSWVRIALSHSVQTYCDGSQTAFSPLHLCLARIKLFKTCLALARERSQRLQIDFACCPQGPLHPTGLWNQHFCDANLICPILCLNILFYNFWEKRYGQLFFFFRVTLPNWRLLLKKVQLTTFKHSLLKDPD